MQILYFDRLQRAKEEVPRTCPLTAIWKKERVMARVAVEKKRGFGIGSVLPRTPIPAFAGKENTSPCTSSQTDIRVSTLIFLCITLHFVLNSFL